MTDTAEPQPMWSLGGQLWCDVEPPRRAHRHWPQTIGLIDGVGEVWRCPCAAYGGPREPWVHLGKPRVRSGWLARLIVRWSE